MTYVGLRKVLAREDIEQDFADDVIAIVNKFTVCPNRDSKDVVFCLNQVLRKRNDRLSALDEIE